MSQVTWTRCDGCGIVIESEAPVGWIHIALSEDFPIEVYQEDLGDGNYTAANIAMGDLHLCGVDCLSRWASREILEYYRKKREGS
jgi:hypothetical protein